jgi:hypothetical protein
MIAQAFRQRPSEFDARTVYCVTAQRRIAHFLQSGERQTDAYNARRWKKPSTGVVTAVLRKFLFTYMKNGMQ